MKNYFKKRMLFLECSLLLSNFLLRRKFPDKKNKEGLVGANVVIKRKEEGTTIHKNGTFEIYAKRFPVPLTIRYLRSIVSTKNRFRKYRRELKLFHMYEKLGVYLSL